MATEATFEPVELTAPNGTAHTAHTAVEFNNLVYGQGYKPVQTSKTSTKGTPADDTKTADTAKTPDDAKAATKKA
jgi:hypothetical protein